MADWANIRGVLFDLDGVFYEGQAPIAGGREVLAALDNAGIKYRFVTNTTTQSRRTLAEKLREFGLDIASDSLITAPIATVAYIRAKNYKRCLLVVNDAVAEDFANIPVVTDNPDCVVIGDIGQAWDYALLNTLFGHVMEGADIVAMHKNRFWKTEHGLRLDIGGFVAALEYVTGTYAAVVGKPARAFFEAALQALAVPKDQVIMVGDDIDNDVGAAQEVGIRGVLVRSGKYREQIVAQSSVIPAATIATIADLPTLLGTQ